MSNDQHHDERFLVSECRKHLSSPAGHAFIRMLRAREERRMREAANASIDVFAQRKGAYQEISSILKELERNNY